MYYKIFYDNCFVSLLSRKQQIKNSVARFNMRIVLWQLPRPASVNLFLLMFKNSVYVVDFHIHC